MEETTPRDTIEVKGEKGEYASNGESSLPAYKVPSNVVDTDHATPKKPMHVRIAHSFRRREDNIRLNHLGQQIIDPDVEQPLVLLQVGEYQRPVFVSERDDVSPITSSSAASRDPMRDGGSA